MKPVLAPIGALVVGLLALPALFATGDPAPLACVGSGSVEVVLATIRSRESGGDYTARASGSTASGAYQFVDSTWDGYGGFPQAWQAPPLVQDAKATEMVVSILDAHDGDAAAVPVVGTSATSPNRPRARGTRSQRPTLATASPHASTSSSGWPSTRLSVLSVRLATPLRAWLAPQSIRFPTASPIPALPTCSLWLRSTARTMTIRHGTGQSRPGRPSTPSGAGASSAPCTGLATGGITAVPPRQPAVRRAGSVSPSRTMPGHGGPIATATPWSSASTTSSWPDSRYSCRATPVGQVDRTCISRSARPTDCSAAPSRSFGRFETTVLVRTQRASRPAGAAPE